MATLKYSRQRESIKEFLMAQTTHPTADVVYNKMKQQYPNISLGTVYRNLALLTELGEIQRLPGISGADRYDGRTNPHCHFLCTKCGNVIDLDIHSAGAMIQEAQEESKGKIHGYSANFYGICKDCIKKENDATKP
jgi:Fur family peroxide stress response transcriptional regulator